MKTSALTTKGQVTIPAEVRRQLGLKPGDRVAFIIDADEVRLVRQETRVEAAFGLCKADVSLSDDDIERVIRQRAGR
jgi:AbrB family looped-hinge helix DNA binding protein